MTDKHKKKDQIINELLQLRQQISEWEKSESARTELGKRLARQRRELEERLKELNCLYGVST